MSSNFFLQSAPFNFQIHTSDNYLFNQLQQIYPGDLLSKSATDSIIDFQINFKKQRLSLSQNYAFRLGQNHFRMTAREQMVSVFEWGLNWSVSSFQNRYLCIHAAVLEKNGLSLVLPAPPGSGKSTLCALLMLTGWRLLSDEHCLLDPESGQIVPFVRPVSLKNRSIAVINQRFSNQPVKLIIPDTLKGTLGYLAPSEKSWQGMLQTATPCYVIFPKYNNSVSETEFSHISQSQLFMHLAINSFNYSVLGETGFHTLSNFVRQVVAIRLEYSDTDHALKLIEELD